jgi:hypothetical protein
VSTLIRNTDNQVYLILCLTPLLCFTTLYVCALVTSCKASALAQQLRIRHVMNALSFKRTTCFFAQQPKAHLPAEHNSSHRNARNFSTNSRSVYPASTGTLRYTPRVYSASTGYRTHRSASFLLRHDSRSLPRSPRGLPAPLSENYIRPRPCPSFAHKQNTTFTPFVAVIAQASFDLGTQRVSKCTANPTTNTANLTTLTQPIQSEDRAHTSPSGTILQHRLHQ